MALNKKSTIKFSYHETSFRLKEVILKKTFLASVMARENTPFFGIEYVFCSDDFLLSLNQQYLNHDTYTDILTFTLSLPREPIFAEIYISIDRIIENADTLSRPFEEELSRVMIHGLLHLCGYEDLTPVEKLNMRAKEDFYLKSLSK